ncbi:unnamed protein product [Pedinophyceae sp. YPF-701]|nr:unnamed protein product [Pedinophyceae sp. YPF-701]
MGATSLEPDQLRLTGDRQFDDLFLKLADNFALFRLSLSNHTAGLKDLSAAQGALLSLLGQHEWADRKEPTYAERMFEKVPWPRLKEYADRQRKTGTVDPGDNVEVRHSSAHEAIRIATQDCAVLARSLQRTTDQAEALLLDQSAPPTEERERHGGGSRIRLQGGVRAAEVCVLMGAVARMARTEAEMRERASREVAGQLDVDVHVLENMARACALDPHVDEDAAGLVLKLADAERRRRKAADEEAAAAAARSPAR